MAKDFVLFATGATPVSDEFVGFIIITVLSFIWIDGVTVLPLASLAMPARGVWKT